MIWLKNIRVFTQEIDAVSVAWDVVDTEEDLADYTVSVWRSEAMVGPYAQVSGEIPADSYGLFRDTSANRLTLSRKHIYRLRVRHTESEETLFFGSRDVKRVLDGEDPLGVALESVPDLEAAESIRRFELLARERMGRQALLLHRRTTGQFCPACWEKESRRSLDANCQTCWGTHRAGGFYSPQVFWPVESPPRDVQSILTGLFELEKNDIVVRASSLARLSPRDVVVYATGERWTVQAVRGFHRGGALTWQFVHLRQVVPKDIEHRIPVDWAADSLTAGPVRQYARSTDIESYRRAVAEKGLVDEPVGTKDFPTSPLSETG